MKKLLNFYVCQTCGTSFVKWQGKCSNCGSWNTLVEEIGKPEAEEKIYLNKISGVKNKSEIFNLGELNCEDNYRIDCHDNELNRVLGGGLVKGSLILLGGDPGIGKSTLLLQLAIKTKQSKILYISGEESNQQVKLRAIRLGLNQISSNCYILNETKIESIIKQSSTFNPDILIIDSIQTLYSSLIEASIGSLSQVRNCTSILMQYAKNTGTAVFLIGHVTKEGMIAGPKALEHMVDTVLQFEGERHLTYRIVRTTKNRFGSTSELGIYEMCSTGLREVKNPSEIFLSQRTQNLNGRAIGVFIEGNRPLLVEIQSLVSKATYGNPQRSTTGFDSKRLNMLLAVLEKRANFNLISQDVFLNVTGGIKIEDPAIDLSVCISIVSSYLEKSIPINICFAAEVGLSGEIRAINRIEQRILEAEKLGFTCIYISEFNFKSLVTKNFKIQVKSFAVLQHILKDLGMMHSGKKL